ncbi:DNA-binding protein [Cupriavidus sp. KK10]|jgi:hypothetical protein|uniref:DNA-binding protein n=1 Tax=Cupriavidus sp. KK10 TaxID=1478019 RepID=UPI001BABE4F1|nr:DNA-binding protein [Cupriavidus sp. KK10]
MSSTTVVGRIDEVIDMKRRGISAADVVRACVALKRRGRRLGPVNVRLELGRGSYSTIVRHLRKLAFSEPRRRP